MIKKLLITALLMPTLVSADINKVDLYEYKDAVDTWAVHAKSSVYELQRLMDKCSSSQASEVTLDGMLRTRELLKQQLKIYYRLEKIVYKALTLSLKDTLKNNKYVQVTSTKIIKTHIPITKTMQNDNPCNVEYI